MQKTIVVYAMWENICKNLRFNQLILLHILLHLVIILFYLCIASSELGTFVPWAIAWFPQWTIEFYESAWFLDFGYILHFFVLLLVELKHLMGCLVFIFITLRDIEYKSNYLQIYKRSRSIIDLDLNNTRVPTSDITSCPGTWLSDTL